MRQRGASEAFETVRGLASPVCFSISRHLSSLAYSRTSPSHKPTSTAWSTHDTTAHAHIHLHRTPLCQGDARADVKARSARERCTALSLAAEGGHAALVRMLVAAGADVNAASGTTPHPASGASKYPCVFFADW
jgi:uncharacterized glyoxalase superfamily protein PhnB